MEIRRKAIAGTLESSDIFVEIEPSTGICIDVQSVVYEQFGQELLEVAADVLEQFQVKGAKVFLNDRGALECTVRARVEAAIKRAGTED